MSSMSTTPPLHKRLPHSRHASRERDDSSSFGGPTESVVTFDSDTPLQATTLGAKASYPAVSTGTRKEAYKKLLQIAALLLFVFFLNALYLWGTFWRSTKRVHNLPIAVVDFDGGSIGAALKDAVGTISGQTKPNFVILDASKTSAAGVLKSVYNGDYWGAIYAVPGASNSFTAALSDDASAASYNASAALIYTGLEVRYNSVWGKHIEPALMKAVTTTQATFAAAAIPPLLSSSKSYSSAAASVLGNAVGATYINLTPFRFGARELLNTAGFVFPILLIALYLGAQNTLFTASGFYTNLTFRSHLKLHYVLGLIWTLVVGLGSAGWYALFDEDDNIGVKWFFALWAVMWIYAQIHFNLLTSLSILSPEPAFPLILLTLLVLALSSIALPLALSHPIFRIAYAYPSHATWGVLMTIFGRGALKSGLKYELPVLAVWWAATGVLSWFAVRRRTVQNMAVVMPVSHATAVTAKY